MIQHYSYINNNLI